MKKLINISAIVCVSVFLFNIGCSKIKRCKDGNYYNGVVKYVGDFCEYKIELEDTLDSNGKIIHLLPEDLPARVRRDEKQVVVDFEVAEHPLNKAICFENDSSLPSQTIYVKLNCIQKR